ncbi:MAG: glycosyltransferase family 9 protein [Desulfobaccales bacterium]
MKEPASLLRSLSKLSKVREIALWHSWGIGDFIQFLPTMQSLRRALSPEVVHLIFFQPEIGQLVPLAEQGKYQVHNPARRARPLLKMAGQLRGRPGLLWVTASLGNPWPAWALGKLCGAWLTAGSVAPGQRAVFDFSGPVDPSRSQTRQFLEIARCMGIDPVSEYPCLAVPASQAASAATQWGLEPEGQLLISLQPGGNFRYPFKRWPLGRYLALGKWLHDALGAKVLVLGDGRESQMCRKLAAEIGGGAAAVCGADLGQVAALLASCRLHVGNDSALAHLAAAVGTPTVVIFGPTEPARCLPLQEGCVAVHHRLPCSGCYDTGRYACDRLECLLKIEPKMVQNKINQLLSKQNVRKGS